MNATEPRIDRPRSLALALLLVAVALAAGCVYRPDIQQGNLLGEELVDQVTVGMTRSQVRFLLGTPMVSDPFAPQRWDYVYRLQHGRDRNVDMAHFIVYFDGDTVRAVERAHAPKPPPKKKPDSGQADTLRDPPPAPSISQPQPDAPRPGD